MNSVYFKVFNDSLEILQELDDAARGRLFLAMAMYANGQVMELSGMEKIVFIQWRQAFDRDQAAQEQKSDARKAAGKAGAANRWGEKEEEPIANDSKKDFAIPADGKTEQPMPNDGKHGNNKDKDKDKDYNKDNKESTVAKATAHARFTQPTLDEVRAYCKERGSKVDAQRWLDYYAANGWKVGKNPMKDWKAAVRTWESNGYGAASPPKQVTAQQYQQREYSDDALEARAGIADILREARRMQEGA